MCLDASTKALTVLKDRPIAPFCQGIAMFLQYASMSALQKGKSAIILSNLGSFAKFDPGLFMYVRPVRGLEYDLC